MKDVFKRVSVRAAAILSGLFMLAGCAQEVDKSESEVTHKTPSSGVSFSHDPFQGAPKLSSNQGSSGVSFSYDGKKGCVTKYEDGQGETECNPDWVAPE